MKKIILLLIMVLTCCISVNAQSYSRSGDTFTATTKAKEKVEPIKTKYFYTDSHGDKYPIFMSASTGSCFINKVSSKTGKEYRMYLGKEISIEICKEMGVEYKGKK